MRIQRVAVIFDNTSRPETTGVYCRRALGQLVEVEHFLPMELPDIPRDRFDLFLNIDDGLEYRFPPELTPAALWAIDTHLDFDRILRKASDFDLVFAAQRDGAARLQDHGVSTAAWLPLACDPEIHARHQVEKQFDVCFVGNEFPGPRSDLLALIKREFPNHFVGRRYFEAMAETFSASRIVFNQSLRNDLNMRVFEALACGSLLITNDLRDNGLAELFQDGVHLVTFQQPAELLDKVRFYLARGEERERIARTGREAALANHTYLHRMRVILETVAEADNRKPQSNSYCGDPIRPLKGRQYFEFDRPEVVAMIPTTARHVLDIGCGSGRLGEAVKRRQSAEVVGIELVPAAAEAARSRLDHVVIGNIEDDALDFPADRFDCVVCADVLEHLRNPRAVLHKIRQWLATEGCLVASVPNVRNHSVVQSLLQGNWTYEPAGLLDDDHVRFFTRREIEKILFRTGFDVTDVRFVPGPGHDEWVAAGRPATVEAAGLNIQAASVADAEEFFVYQYLVRARPASLSDHGLTSIVLVTHNQMAYTRLCLESIRHCTDEPYELIVVDNGSTDDTVDYLRAYEGARLIVNRENRGFPAAANQGIEAARGQAILLLNNDTVVSTGWLRRLLDALYSGTTVGLAGPCTNNISGAQQVAVSYSDLACLDGFAWDWGKSHRAQRIETDRLVGFCLLFRRTVIERIGLLDERFGVGNFEDDDFCRRALDAGFRAVIAEDAFIHHFGSRTFVGSGIDFAAVLDENRRKYEEKWNDSGSTRGSGTTALESSRLVSPVESSNSARTMAGSSAPLSGPAVHRSQSERIPRSKFMISAPHGGGLCLLPNDIKLSLCMIVRDNESTIGPCLQSIRPWVDEIVVVDTGSNDKTREICQRLGARLFEFPWCDDFSAARNESLKHARGEWLFWMDSDDTIFADCGRRLRALADGSHAENILGYVMQVHCPGSGREAEHDVTVVDHVKLIRNRPDLNFEGRIHEQVLPAIRRANGDVAWTDLYVEHSGADRSQAGWQRKLERDLRILHRELAERPSHPFVLFNLGMTYADAKRYDEAIEFLRRSLAVSKPEESHMRKVYALLTICLQQVERHDEAWQSCQRGLCLYPGDKELLFRSAMLHHHFGRLTEAEQAYLCVINGREVRHFTSVDRGLTGFKARHNLALVYEDMGRFDLAERQWRLIIGEVPDNRSGWRGLGDVLMRSGKHEEAQKLVAQLLNKEESLVQEGKLLRGRLAASRGDTELAILDFEAADQTDPNDLEPLRSLCRILFENAELERAALKLHELTNRAPNDAAAFHNLGTVHFQRKEFLQAARAYERSVELRRNSADTWLQWGWSLKHAGRSADAIAAWQELLNRFPGHTDALSAVESARLPDAAVVHGM